MLKDIKRSYHHRQYFDKECLPFHLQPLFEDPTRPELYQLDLRRYRPLPLSKIRSHSFAHTLAFTCCEHGFSWTNTGLGFASHFIPDEQVYTLVKMPEHYPTITKDQHQQRHLGAAQKLRDQQIAQRQQARDAATAAANERAAKDPNFYPFKQQPTDCKLTAWSVNCSHGQKLDLMRYSSGDTAVIEVLSSSDKSKATTVTLTKTVTCTRNCRDLPRGSNVQVSSPGPTQGFYHKDTPKFAAVCKAKPVNQSFSYFLRKLLIPKTSPTSYSVNLQRCSGEQAAVQIDAYAPLHWHGELTLGFQMKQYQDKFDTYSPGSVGGQWTVGGELTVTQEGQTWHYGKSYESQHPIAQQLFSKLSDFMNHVMPFFNSLAQGYVNLSITPPLLKLTGDVELKENVAQRTVYPVGKIGISLTPLIGAKLSVNLLEWLLLAAGGGIASFVKAVLGFTGDTTEKLKQEYQQYLAKESPVNGNLKVMLEIDSTIGGDISWHNTNGHTWNSDGKIDGKLPITAKAEASISVKVWIVKFSAGTNASVNSGLSVQYTPQVMNSEPAGEFQFTFDGLVIEWAMYVVAKLNNDQTKTPKMHTRGKPTHKSASVEKRIEKSGQQQLIAPKCWPEESTTTAITDDNLL